MVFSSRTIRSAIKNLRTRRKKNRSKSRRTRRRRQAGGSGIGDLPYRGIPPEAVLTNPMKWGADESAEQA